VIVDTAAYEAKGLAPVEAAETLLAAGVTMLQYRHKGQFTEQRFQEAGTIAQACRERNAVFVLNDRADYAHLLKCGVHVGQDDLPALDARKITGDGTIIGLSTHNRQQLEEAINLPVDYVAVGPVFPTASKTNRDPTIPLREIPGMRVLSHKPLVAIGGITFDSALRVLDSGADSLAVISGLLPEGHRDVNGLKAMIGRWLEMLEGRSPAF
jgi:thiamine-phosphate pyrophosphorylase